MNCDSTTNSEFVFCWADIDPRDTDEFNSCPLNFIPKGIFEWYSEYKFYKDFSGSAIYKDKTFKWLEAVYVYEKYLHMYLRVANGKPIDR